MRLDAKFNTNNGIFALFITIVIMSAIGCGAKKVAESDVQYITIEKHDTLRDSVFTELTHIERDSIIIYQKGDTIYRDRWRTIYKDAKQGIERERVVIRTDTIYKDREIVIERRASLLSRLRHDAAVAGVLSVLALVALWLVRRK